MDIIEFLTKHYIVCLGESAETRLINGEIIVDCIDDFIDTVYDEKYYITYVCFWERTLLKSQPQIGHGGPLDPRDKDNYYFAETDFCSVFNHLVEKETIKEFINGIKVQFPNIDLYTSFMIEPCSEQDSKRR